MSFVSGIPLELQHLKDVAQQINSWGYKLALVLPVLKPQLDKKISAKVLNGDLRGQLGLGNPATLNAPQNKWIQR